MKKKLEDYLFRSTIDKNSHIIAKYFVKSKDLLRAAKGIAIGQSIGNPDVRLDSESVEILENHLAKIMDYEENLISKNAGVIRIAYPLNNYDTKEDGVTQLMCSLMGGQMDIELIESCQLIDVDLPADFLKNFKGPKIGCDEIKKRAKVENRPLLGGIVKPKTGLSVDELKDVCIKMVQGGVDFIKEDEILSNPSCCPFEKRVEVVNDAVQNEASKMGKEVFYAPCINSDLPYLLKRLEFLVKKKINSYHLNIWAGLPTYRYLRSFDYNIAMHYQKSGDRVMTDAKNIYSVHWKVLLKLARISGADFIHAGMWGGYLSDTKEDLSEWIKILTSNSKEGFPKTIASLSCGSHPGLVDSTIKNFGNELMMSLGGSMHGHPSGTIAGARAMRQAFDCNSKNLDPKNSKEKELQEAIKKWGYKND
tara:strand:+ start:514 stop:1776 length:1263 start_codon:yes stop_codon:yes gene_type:complete